MTERKAALCISDAIDRFYPNLLLAMGWSQVDMLILDVIRQMHLSPRIKLYCMNQELEEDYLEFVQKVTDKYDPIEFYNWSKDPLEGPKAFGFEAVLIGGTGGLWGHQVCWMNDVAWISPFIDWSDEQVSDAAQKRNLLAHPQSEGLESVFVKRLFEQIEHDDQVTTDWLRGLGYW